MAFREKNQHESSLNPKKRNPRCGDLQVAKWGSRRGLRRYRCGEGHCFSVDFRPKKNLLGPYLAGPSIRNIASYSGNKKSAVADRLKRELIALPRNEHITRDFCTRFGGVLCVDGVYVRVRGLPKKIPFIYGVDFITHDIPAGILDFSESHTAFVRLFRMLKNSGYPLRYVVADEAPALLPALSRVFPEAGVQLCHVHVLRNIRAALGLSSRNRVHLPFFQSIQKLLAAPGEAGRQSLLREIEKLYDRHPLYWKVLQSLGPRWDDLFRFEDIRKEGLACPKTNNLTEAYNNHFKARVESARGFGSLASAERFLNAWMLRRRFTPFHSCGKPFRHLNGHTPFSKSRDPDLPYPDILL